MSDDQNRELLNRFRYGGSPGLLQDQVPATVHHCQLKWKRSAQEEPRQVPRSDGSAQAASMGCWRFRFSKYSLVRLEQSTLFDKSSLDETKFWFSEQCAEGDRNTTFWASFVRKGGEEILVPGATIDAEKVFTPAGTPQR